MALVDIHLELFVDEALFSAIFVLVSVIERWMSLFHRSFRPILDLSTRSTEILDENSVFPFEADE